MTSKYRLKLLIYSFSLILLINLIVLFLFRYFPPAFQLVILMWLSFGVALVIIIIQMRPFIKIAAKSKKFLLSRGYKIRDIEEMTEVGLIEETLFYCFENWQKLENLIDSGDLTSRLEEKNLTRARRMALFEGAAYPILILDMNRKIIDVNNEFALLVVYDEIRLEGADVGFVLPDNEILDQLISSIENQIYWHGETELMTSKGDFISVNLRVTKIVSDDITLIQIFVDDLRALRQKERELERQTKQIEKFDKLMINRELKMIDLKKENESLMKTVRKYNTKK